MIGRILVPKFPKPFDLATATHFRSRPPVSYLPLHAQSSYEPQTSCSPLKLVSKTGVRKNAASSRHSNRGLVCQLIPSKQESAFPSSWNVDGQIPKENMGKLQTKIHKDEKNGGPVVPTWLISMTVIEKSKKTHTHTEQSSPPPHEPRVLGTCLMRPRDTIGPRVGEAKASSSVRIPTGMSLLQAARHPRVGRGKSEREERLKEKEKKKKKEEEIFFSQASGPGATLEVPSQAPSFM